MMSDSDDEEMPGEANQWCNLLQIPFTDNTGPKLLKIMGITTAMRISETFSFTIFIAPVIPTAIDENMIDILESCARMSCLTV